MQRASRSSPPWPSMPWRGWQCPCCFHARRRTLARCYLAPSLWAAPWRACRPSASCTSQTNSDGIAAVRDRWYDHRDPRLVLRSRSLDGAVDVAERRRPRALWQHLPIGLLVARSAGYCPRSRSGSDASLTYRIDRSTSGRGSWLGEAGIGHRGIPFSFCGGSDDLTSTASVTGRATTR